MCSTCGCGKKADTFEAPKRQRIGNRFISRRKDGTISKNVNVGRSLSADRRRKAKTTASAGQGDKGDLKRAEESCPKCNGVAMDDTTMFDTYYLCGKCDIAWYDGIRDNPITMREFQWIQKNPISHYGVSREEVEELYGKDSNYINYEAESKFDKLSNEIAKDYEKKGKSKDEAEEIGKATAYKIGVAKYGKRGMERKARAGRAKNAESFGAEVNRISHSCTTYTCRTEIGGTHEGSDAMRFLAFLNEIKDGVGITNIQYEDSMANGDPFGNVYFKFDICGYGKANITHLKRLLKGLRQQLINKGADYEDLHRPIQTLAEGDETNEEWYLEKENFGADEKKRSGMKIAPKIQMVNYQDVMTEKMKNQDMKDAESFNAETLHEKGDYRIIAEEDYDVSMGGVFQERDDFDDLMELSDTHGMFTLRLQKKVMGGWETIDSLKGVVPHYGDMEDIALTELNIPEGVDFNAEEFGADGYFPDDSYYGIDGMTYVKRPHHVAYVRKAHAERPMDKGFEYPNMHTDQNKQGKIWDDRTGFRKMDSKERRLFEEIGGKISDFNVVETTQDVVGKTGFNIPTGVASIAVVFMAYMTGKKYGN